MRVMAVVGVLKKGVRVPQLRTCNGTNPFFRLTVATPLSPRGLYPRRMATDRKGTR